MCFRSHRHVAAVALISARRSDGARAAAPHSALPAARDISANRNAPSTAALPASVSGRSAAASCRPHGHDRRRQQADRCHDTSPCLVTIPARHRISASNIGSSEAVREHPGRWGCRLPRRRRMEVLPTVVGGGTSCIDVQMATERRLQRVDRMLMSCVTRPRKPYDDYRGATTGLTAAGRGADRGGARPAGDRLGT
jgi:hypothetical protein